MVKPVDVFLYYFIVGYTHLMSKKNHISTFIHFSFFSHGKSSMELSLYSVLVYVCKVVSVCRPSVVPVHWPFVDRRRRGLSDGHLSVRPAESLVVVSIWPVYFFCHLARWSSLLGGCLAILSAGRASQPYSRPHVLAVFSVARLVSAMLSRPLFLSHHLAVVFSAVRGHRPSHHCLANAICLARLCLESHLSPCPPMRLPRLDCPSCLPLKLSLLELHLDSGRSRGQSRGIFIV